jgi:hypothetical protein
MCSKVVSLLQGSIARALPSLEAALEGVQLGGCIDGRATWGLH